MDFGLGKSGLHHPSDPPNSLILPLWLVVPPGAEDLAQEAQEFLEAARTGSGLGDGFAYRWVLSLHTPAGVLAILKAKTTDAPEVATAGIREALAKANILREGEGQPLIAWALGSEPTWELFQTTTSEDRRGKFSGSLVNGRVTIQENR